MDINEKNQTLKILREAIAVAEIEGARVRPGGNSMITNDGSGSLCIKGMNNFLFGKPFEKIGVGSDRDKKAALECGFEGWNPCTLARGWMDPDLISIGDTLGREALVRHGGPEHIYQTITQNQTSCYRPDWPILPVTR